MTSRWERLAPLSGVVFVVLTAIGIVLMGDSPDFLDEPQKIADFYADDSGRTIAAAYIGLLGSVAFLWFVGVLRSRLRLGEKGDGRLSATAFGGGIAGGALFFMIDAFNLAGGLRADEDGKIDPAVATVLYDMSGLMIAVSALAMAVLVFACAVLALRHGVLPRWLGWISVLLGIGLISPISYVFLLVFLVWVLAVSVLMYLNRAIGIAPVTPGPGVPG